MSTKKSEFTSAFGKSFEVFRCIANGVHDNCGSDDDLSSLLTDGYLQGQIGRLIVYGRISREINEFIHSYEGENALRVLEEASRMGTLSTIVRQPFEEDETKPAWWVAWIVGGTTSLRSRETCYELLEKLGVGKEFTEFFKQQIRLAVVALQTAK